MPSPDPALIDCEATSDSWGPELPAGTATFDHAREVFKTGVTTDNTLTISGGTDRTLFYLSGGYNYQDGTIVGPRNNYERISVRLNGSHRVRDNFTVGGNVAYSNATGEFVQKGSNFSGIALGSWRSAPEFDNRSYLSEENGLHRSYRFPNPSASSVGLQPRVRQPVLHGLRPGELGHRRPHHRQREPRLDPGRRGSGSTTRWAWTTPATTGCRASRRPRPTSPTRWARSSSWTSTATSSTTT